MRTGCWGTCPSRNSGRPRPTRSGCWRWWPARTSNRPRAPTAPTDAGDTGWRIARKVAPERVISTVDPEARHAHKTRARHQDGYKAHVKVEPDTGLITGCALTPAAGAEHSDAAVGIELLADEPDPVEVLGDSAYGTGELLAAAADGGHTAIIKPWPLRPAVDGGFTLDEFTVDETAGTVTCPNQLTRPITSSRRVTFGAALSGLPATGPLHHLGPRPHAAAAPPRRAAARAPGPRHRSGVPGRLPRAPAHGRTVDLLAGRRPQPAAAIRRDPAQRPMAAPPRRRAEPAPPARPRADPQRRVLGAGPGLTRIRRPAA